MSLLDTERATYETVWSSVEGYAQHSPGEQYLPLFLQVAQPPATVLDAGTGSGKGSLALLGAGFDVAACDMTGAGLTPDAANRVPFFDACLWHDFGSVRFEWVYCTDVLEHIPPQFTMLAIDQMLRVAKEGLFLTVSLVPDSFGVWAGKSLHQTVQPFTWWRDSLEELGTVTEARDLISNAVFVVKPR
jgi:2-polyprenyl-3-methyl-5-hydroxy-6-metoxy-1,4-benzoquinol methylase